MITVNKTSTNYISIFNNEITESHFYTSYKELILSIGTCWKEQWRVSLKKKKVMNVPEAAGCGTRLSICHETWVIVSNQPHISETSAKSQPHLASVFLFCKMGLITHILSVSLSCETDF